MVSAEETSETLTGHVAIGTTVAGKYIVERELASGGVGTILLARHLELGHAVAIKYLHARFHQQVGVVERFKREARLVASIRSENVVRVNDVGTLDDGTPYMVMEYLEGEDLGAVVARGPVSVAKAIDWIGQACLALAEAHAVGIIHRDLKPENLFLTRRQGARPIVKVVDFGISKVAANGPASLGIGRTTLANERFGTPFYMSPEQLLSSANVDPRTDIWALGVVLYELLTGEVPFPGPDLPTLIGNVLAASPAPLRATRPDVGAELDALVRSCLSRDPARRPASVDDLSMSLSRIARDLEASPPAAELDGDRPDAARVARQNVDTDFAVVPTPPMAWAPIRTANALARGTRLAWAKPFIVPALLGVVVACVFTTMAVVNADRQRGRSARGSAATSEPSADERAAATLGTSTDAPAPAPEPPAETPPPAPLAMAGNEARLRAAGGRVVARPLASGIAAVKRPNAARTSPVRPASTSPVRATPAHSSVDDESDLRLGR